MRFKWGSYLSADIQISKGTRQGGLTSSFIFNLFYKDLIHTLSASNGGVVIALKSCNVFIYACDILPCGLTVTGLQQTMKVSNEYVSNHGLSFNPNKIECIMFGECFFSRSVLYDT